MVRTAADVTAIFCQRPLEEGYLAYHRQGHPDPGGPPQMENPLPEKMGGHSPLEQEEAESQLGMTSHRGRGARHTMTPLMFRILAVAYPELDGHLRASQQHKGVSTVTSI
ncbi:hypothetical protein NDU88_001563 [Pleurodeles waltl]|uniref:Uncharacterized protein n=1 Tax=Pleurodeles waltl TaxID=8319 RepID=A0AAV7VC31_PLEWA|nr:hypothetical protein NDU88_001563 [Pleurodeles waltl]